MEAFEFDRDVLEMSHQGAIVVDFWAPWCGPCKFLGPVIEELADQAENWTLVKVNTDENPELMERYHIRGIPAVKMFYRGEVVGEFTGALPKHQIEKWLALHLPDSRREKLEELVERLANDKDPEALSDLKKFAEQNPDFTEAAIALAENIVWHDPVRASNLVSQVKIGDTFYQRAENIIDIARFVNCELKEDSPARAFVESARRDLDKGELDETLENLVQAVTLDKKYCEDLPRKTTIAMFNILGPSHPLTQKYRRQFDMALY